MVQTPFCKLVNINIEKYFFKLIDKHLNQYNILHKIFNRKTLKISYSYLIVISYSYLIGKYLVILINRKTLKISYSYLIVISYSYLIGKYLVILI